MKNIKDLTPAEMRIMLKSIKEVTERTYPDLSAGEQSIVQMEEIAAHFVEEYSPKLNLPN